MPIDTKFQFKQEPGPGAVAAALQPTELLEARINPAALSQLAVPNLPPLQLDKLGALRDMVGTTPAGNAQRKWKGTGFNMIWRPNFGGVSGPTDFFLELNMTAEEMDFTEITGPTGIANRGLLQGDIFMGGMAYLQTISDSFDNSGQHFETGVWAHVPPTTNPAEKESVVRMGSIPHGTTINLQGTTLTTTTPQFAASSITPFKIGSPDDGHTGLVHFPEEILTNVTNSRTPKARVASLTQAQLTNPNLFLSQAIAGQTIIKTVVIQVTSDSKPAGSVPNAGGGTDNIAFLTGTVGGNPNALVPKVTAIFWIETVKQANGSTFLQLQYTQRVLLNFSGLSWPHVTVGTLRQVP